jgi:hypothetical protein
LNPWKLPPPEIEYHADTCAMEVVSGAPTLYFGQVGPGGRPLNTIAISMSPKQLTTFVMGLEPISASLDRTRSQWDGHPVVPDAKGEGLSHDNFRKFTATMCLGSCDEHVGMLDFHNLAQLVKERIVAAGKIEPQIRGVVRVFTPLPVLDRLIAMLKQWQEKNP